MEDLLYTISKVKLLEDILMPQPIVPVEIPQSRRFDSKKRNDIWIRCCSMTIHLSSLGQVYLVCGKTDMRQGIDSLAYLITTHFELDPFSGQVFLFCGGRKDRFKALYWDGQGF